MSEISEIYQETKEVAESFLAAYQKDFTAKTLLVVGCSTSEVMGGVIGKDSHQQAGVEIATAIMEVAAKYNIALAAQCCEHLNRALVVEKATALAHNLEIVEVIPMPKAGGSFATAVHRKMQQPVLVEMVQADFGLDIGDTMIGMHLKRVAIPLRLSPNKIGAAKVQGAKTRPKLIGGQRAVYVLPEETK